ncbi:MAG: VWA-like domain-containing protein [Bacteroidales bacterium]|nr:VWA-like domain-containing protein [Bacteroidales bacterium]
MDVESVNIKALKATLIDLQPCQTDFTIEICAGKKVSPASGGYKLGDYCYATHIIRIFSNRISSAKEALEVAIHEYAHHLMWEAFHFGKLKRRVGHGKPFWDCYHQLVQVAKIKGVFNTANDVEDPRIQEITESWFILEPLLMMGLLSHQVKTNRTIRTLRCGKGVIEYNPQYAKFLTKQQLEERLRAEVIRLLLCHPYRHYNDRGHAYIASNITLNENYNFAELMFKATDYWREKEYRNQNFEFYYRELNKLEFPFPPDAEGDHESKGNQQNVAEQPNDGVGQKTSDKDNQGGTKQQTDMDEPGAGASIPQEAAALWEADDFMDQKMKEIIEWAHTTMQWGTLPGNLVQTLMATLRPEIDYRKVLSAFRASVLSSTKMLTRFKPSRRYGFNYMGKKNEFTTRLLIAVDVSGSISDKEIRLFYSVVNRFFKYGIETMDVLQFDSEIKPPVTTIKKAEKSIKVHGRGGTDFQPAINYFETAKKPYDGLIFFTDGYAPQPKMKPNTIRRTVWICSNKENYHEHKEWMEKCGRCCWVKEE